MGSEDIFEAVLNDNVSVGTTSQVILYNNPRRKVFSFSNVSTGGQTITITQGFPSVANKGIPLPVGASVTDQEILNYHIFKGVINAISSAAGGSLSVYER